jgi:hypothetical protein
VVVGKQGPTCESIAECPQVEGVPVARVATVRVAAVVSRCLCESALTVSTKSRAERSARSCSKSGSGAVQPNERQAYDVVVRVKKKVDQIGVMQDSDLPMFVMPDCQVVRR